MSNTKSGERDPAQDALDHLHGGFDGARRLVRRTRSLLVDACRDEGGGRPAQRERSQRREG